MTTPIPVAIALKYEKGTDAAPRVVAKGRGDIAEAILALAREHDIVIDANPELAAALAEIELDESIPIALYAAVAQVIGFVLRRRESSLWEQGEGPSEPVSP